MKLEGYRGRSKSDLVEISIIGNYQKAESILSGKEESDNNHKVQEEEIIEKKPGEISDNSKKIKKKQKKSIKKNEPETSNVFESDLKINSSNNISEDITQKFPLALKIVLKRPLNRSMEGEIQAEIDAIYPIELYFMLYYRLGLIVCTAKSTKNEKVTSIKLLHSLFSEDDGHYAMDYLNSNDVAWVSEEEKPYSWPCFLGGVYSLAFLNDLPVNEAYYYDPSQVTVESIMKKINSRVISICVLQYQVDYLSKNHKIAPDIMKNIASQPQFRIIKDKTAINEFNQTIREFFVVGASRIKFEFLQPQNTIISSLQKNRNIIPMKIPSYKQTDNGTYVKSYIENSLPCKFESGYYFNLLIERSGFRIRAFIEISYNYPNVVPNFVLCMESAKRLEEEKKALDVEELEGNNFGYSHILREIELELMKYWPEYCTEKEILYLLSYQIKKLTTCIEIFVDTENEKPTTLYKKGKKGIFHSRPFAYNANENIYEQR